MFTEDDEKWDIMDIMMKFDPIVISPLQFVIDEPRKPRIVGRGIKERLMWIVFFFVILLAFIANNVYFIGALSQVKTYDEKYEGVPQLMKESEKSFKSVNTRALRNVNPDYFNNAILSISQVPDSYSDAAIVEIEEKEEWKSFKDLIVDYRDFIIASMKNLVEFEQIRTSRVANSSCGNDYVWKLNSFRIKSRFSDELAPQMVPANLADFKGYADSMKTEVPKSMLIETGNVSRHLQKLAGYYDFLSYHHINYLKDIKENNLVTRSLQNQHFFAIVIVCGFTIMGVVYTIFMIYLIIQLIRHKDVDYLQTELSTVTQPEVFRRFLEVCQHSSWCFAVFLAFLFAGLWVNNKIAPQCSVGLFRSEDRFTSFYSDKFILVTMRNKCANVFKADAFEVVVWRNRCAIAQFNFVFFEESTHGTYHFLSGEMFQKCAKNRTTVVALFGDDILVTPNKLVADIISVIQINPLATKFYDQVVQHHRLNEELHRFLGELIVDECPTGLSKEELETQQKLIQTIIDKDDKFEKAVQKLKSMKLESLIHDAFFEEIKDGVNEAAESSNRLIKKNDLKCTPISLLDEKCWALNCQKTSYFDESLIHWVVMAYLYIIVSFSVLRIYNLNEQSAEQWEIDMANAPRFFGKNTSNPRYVRNPRD